MTSDGVVRFSFEDDKISISVIRVVDGVPREATALIDAERALAYGDTLKALGEFKISEAAPESDRDFAALSRILPWNSNGKRTA